MLLTGYTVRRATKDDVHVLVRMRLMLQQHMEKASARIFKLNENWRNGLQDFYGGIIENPDALLLLAIDQENGQAVGMATSLPVIDRKMEVQQYVNIDTVWVDENHRRKGVCSLLIKSLMEYYRDLGITAFTLNYVIENFEADSTWRALGFEPVIYRCNKTIS